MGLISNEHTSKVLQDALDKSLDVNIIWERLFSLQHN